MVLNTHFTSFIIICFLINNCNSKLRNSAGCFCKLEGRIDDCSCNIDTVDHFNNAKLYPLLQSVLVTDYFRYIKVNLNRGCPFWHDDSKCSIKDCSVKTCSEEQLPPGLKGHYETKAKQVSLIHYMVTWASSNVNKFISKFKEAEIKKDVESCDGNTGELGAVNVTISDENYQDFKKWQKHDDSVDTFCEMDDETENLQYVDLLLNPERYTGYKGSSAHRIWNSIYKENCFKFGGDYGPYTTSKNLNSMCLEKRAFYRAISGLHSSISIHLCSQYYTKAKDCFGKGAWGPNVKEFHRRFDPELTDSEGPHWLKNLYFIYLLELRAIAKAAYYFEKELFYTGNEENDKGVRTAIRKVLEVAKSFPDHFDENGMFSGNNKEAKKLKEEFRLHFLNISKIMDCVGCDKCKLWGKIQVQGLGTAFKILFSKHPDTLDYLPPHRKQFRLSRTEIVSLFNAFGRLSNSIVQLENFRMMLSRNHKIEL